MIFMDLGLGLLRITAIRRASYLPNRATARFYHESQPLFVQNGWGPSLPADPSSDVATRTGKPIATAVEVEPGAPTDVDLMLRIQAEDADALSQLYDRYWVQNVTEEDIHASDTRILMAKVINSLPVAQQQVIELAFFQGMSQREIASHTNIPLGTVKTRLELGLKKIYDGLKELKDEL
jgi:RNA polymerase sigma factor (sigma-70 family)